MFVDVFVDIGTPNGLLSHSLACQIGAYDHLQLAKVAYIIYNDLQIHQIALIPIPPAVWQKIFLKALSQNHPKSGSERQKDPKTTLQSFKV